MFRDQGAALQQEYANKNAFNRVRPPKFGPAPAAPMGRTRQQDFTGRDFAFGLAKAGFDAVGAGLAKAPDMPFNGAGAPAPVPAPSIAAAASGPFPSYGLSPAMTGSVSGSISNMYRPGMTDFGALTSINPF